MKRATLFVGIAWSTLGQPNFNLAFAQRAPNNSLVPNVTDGMNALGDEHDYAKALKNFLPLAKEGDQTAETMLGFMYQSGLGVKKDDDSAIIWYSDAANKGDVYAENDLAILYNNEPSDASHFLAVKWLLKAANKNNPQAEFLLDLLYSEGRGVPQDFFEARKWYELSADQNDGRAQYSLGSLFASGQGGLQDYVHSYMWFNIAAANQTNNSNIANAIIMRDQIASKMTAEEIAEGQALSAAWKPIILK